MSTTTKILCFAAVAVLIAVFGDVLPAPPDPLAWHGLPILAPLIVGMTALAIEQSHLEVGLAAVADAFSGTVTSDVVSMKHHGRVRFVYHWGVGTTGTTLITIEACDDTTPTNVSAVPFRYRSTVAGSAPGAWAAATSAGFTTTAGSNQVVECEIAVEALLASGYSFVRSKSVEQVDSPLLGGILIEMLEPRIADGAPATATA